MIGLDTNVLVRYLAQDDPTQATLATRLIEQELTDEVPGFVGLVVLVETVWVLQRLYRARPEEVRETVADLLLSRHIVVEQREVVARALAICDESACGLVDAIVVASALAAGCERSLSFDRGALRAGMSLLQ